MRIEIRADNVLIEGYVNAVGRDSRPLRSSDGSQFIEQIVPGAFARALTRHDIDILLNHKGDKFLGSTRTNLTLVEDTIGLKARAIITDKDVIEKARAKKLRGWSFGFYDIKTSEEEVKEGLRRRFVEDLDLIEVSIIDDTLLPAYQGTLIETRAEGAVNTGDVLQNRADYLEEIDYSKYKNKIQELERV